MRRRDLVALMTMLMVVGMTVGCGNDSASSSSYSAGSLTTSEPPASVVEESSETSQPEEDGNGLVYNEQLGIYESADSSEEDFSAPEDERVGTRPGADEDVITVPQANEKHGIIMCMWWWYGIGDNFIIFSLDPETGEYTEINHLFYRQKDGVYYYELPVIAYSQNRSNWFSNDFSKVAVSYTSYGAKESRAGWVDNTGTFFDVPAAIGMGPENEFVVQPNYYSIGFTEDGYFVFAEVTDCNERIDGENIEKYGKFYYVALDDYTVVHGGNPLKDGAIAGGNVTALTGWINDDEYLANYNDNNVVRRINDQTYIEEYVPGDARVNWGGIVGPDGTFAFASRPKDSRDDTGIYITQRDGSGLKRIFTCDDIFTYGGQRKENFGSVYLFSWQ